MATSPALVKRLGRELSELIEDPVPGCFAGPREEHDMGRWHAAILGPEGSPYWGGVFTLHINFGPSYPHTPPEVKVLTKIYHPNFYAESGDICLSILKQSSSGDGWMPSMTVATVLLSIQMLIVEPNPSDAANTQAGQLLYGGHREEHDRLAREWLMKHAYAHTDTAAHELDIIRSSGGSLPYGAEWGDKHSLHDALGEALLAGDLRSAGLLLIVRDSVLFAPKAIEAPSEYELEQLGFKAEAIQSALDSSDRDITRATLALLAHPDPPIHTRVSSEGDTYTHFVLHTSLTPTLIQRTLSFDSIKVFLEASRQQPSSDAMMDHQVQVYLLLRDLTRAHAAGYISDAAKRWLKQGISHGNHEVVAKVLGVLPLPGLGVLSSDSHPASGHAHMHTDVSDDVDGVGVSMPGPILRTDSVMDHFRCPVSKSILVEPVSLPCGRHILSKVELMKHLRANNRSCPLGCGEFPDYFLKQAAPNTSSSSASRSDYHGLPVSTPLKQTIERLYPNEVRAKVLGDLADAREMEPREAGVTVAAYSRSFRSDPEVMALCVEIVEGWTRPTHAHTHTRAHTHAVDELEAALMDEVIMVEDDDEFGGGQEVRVGVSVDGGGGGVGGDGSEGEAHTHTGVREAGSEGVEDAQRLDMTPENRRALVDLGIVMELCDLTKSMLSPTAAGSHNAINLPPSVLCRALSALSRLTDDHAAVARITASGVHKLLLPKFETGVLPPLGSSTIVHTLCILTRCFSLEPPDADNEDAVCREAAALLDVVFTNQDLVNNCKQAVAWGLKVLTALLRPFEVIPSSFPADATLRACCHTLWPLHAPHDTHVTSAILQLLSRLVQVVGISGSRDLPTAQVAEMWVEGCGWTDCLITRGPRPPFHTYDGHLMGDLDRPVQEVAARELRRKGSIITDEPPKPWCEADVVVVEGSMRGDLLRLLAQDGVLSVGGGGDEAVDVVCRAAFLTLLLLSQGADPDSTSGSYERAVDALLSMTSTARGVLSLTKWARGGRAPIGISSTSDAACLRPQAMRVIASLLARADACMRHSAHTHVCAQREGGAHAHTDTPVCGETEGMDVCGGESEGVVATASATHEATPHTHDATHVPQPTHSTHTDTHTDTYPPTATSAPPPPHTHAQQCPRPLPLSPTSQSPPTKRQMTDRRRQEMTSTFSTSSSPCSPAVALPPQQAHETHVHHTHAHRDDQQPHHPGSSITGGLVPPTTSTTTSSTSSGSSSSSRPTTTTSNSSSGGSSSGSKSKKYLRLVHRLIKVWEKPLRILPELMRDHGCVSQLIRLLICPPLDAKRVMLVLKLLQRAITAAPTATATTGARTSSSSSISGGASRLLASMGIPAGTRITATLPGMRERRATGTVVGQLPDSSLLVSFEDPGIMEDRVTIDRVVTIEPPNPPGGSTRLSGHPSTTSSSSSPSARLSLFSGAYSSGAYGGGGGGGGDSGGSGSGGGGGRGGAHTYAHTHPSSSSPSAHTHTHTHTGQQEGAVCMALTPVCAGRVVVAVVRVMTAMLHNPKAVQACVRLLESLVEMVRPADGWMERAFGLCGAPPTHPHTHTDDTHTRDVRADEGLRGVDDVCVCGADEDGATHACVCASVGEGGEVGSTHGCAGGGGLECLQRVIERSRDNGPVRLLRKLVQSVDAMVDAVVDTTTSGTGSRLLEAVFQAVRRRVNGNAAMAMSTADTETTDDDEEMRCMGFGGGASSSDETKEETRLAEEKDDSVPYLASRLAALRERMVAHRAMMRRRERDRGQPGSGGGGGGGSDSILREGGTHRPPSPPQPPPPTATYRPPPSSSSSTYRRATGMLFGGIDDDDDDDGDDSMDEEDFLALHSVMMPSAALRATAAPPPSSTGTTSTDHRQRYLEYSRLRHARYATATSATATASGAASSSSGGEGGPTPAEGSIEQLMTEVLELVEVLMRGRESVVTPSGVKVSSGQSTAHHLFAKWQDDAPVAPGPSAAGFWQSHGSPPHWVQFNLPSNWSEVQLRTENFEQGYSVKDLSVHVGAEVDPFPAFAVEASMFDTDDDDSPVPEHMPPEMTEVASLILDQKDAWVTLLKREDLSSELRDSVRIFKLQIKSNHQGLNCKVRRLRVLAKRATSEKGAHTRESLKVAVVEAGALHALVDILKKSQTLAPASSSVGIPSAPPSSNATRSMQATIRARAFRVLRTLVDDVRAVPGIQEVNTVQRCGVEPPPRSRPVQSTRSGADVLMVFPMGAPSLAVTDQDSSSGILEWRITHSTTSSSSSSSTSSSSTSSRKLPSYSPSTSQHGYFAVTVQAAAPPTTTTPATTNPPTASSSSSSSGAGRLYSPASGHHRQPLVVVRTPGHPRSHSSSSSSSSSAPTSSSSSSSPYGGGGGGSGGGNTQTVDRELAMQGRTLTLRLDALSGTLSIITDQPLPGQSSNAVVIQLPPSCASTPVTMGISAGQGASITFHDARLSTDQSLAAAHSSAMARRMEREREREARMEGRYPHHPPPPGSFGAYMSYRERLAAEEEVLFRNGPFGDRLDRGIHGGPSSSSAAASSSSSSSHTHARAELRERVIAHLRTTMGVEQNDAQAMVEAMDEGTMIALLNGNGAPVRGSASRGGYI